MKRREFLQAGIAAIPLIRSVLPGGVLISEAPAVPLYKVIFDERFPVCVAFAAEARRLGSSVHGIRGDITSVWYNDLYYRWRDSPAAVAGLTTHRSLFCLDMFARDAGLRLVHYADHRILAGGSVEHEVFGAEAAQQTTRLKQAGTHWSAEAASQVARLAQAGLRPVRKTADPLVAASEPQPLVSWVIAPVLSPNGKSNNRMLGRTE